MNKSIITNFLVDPEDEKAHNDLKLIFQNELSAYGVNSYELADCLKHHRFGYEAQGQFQIFRDSYIFLTWRSLASQGKSIASAYLNEDLYSVSAITKSSFKNGGSGHEENAEVNLLLRLFNDHGVTVFGIEPVSLSDCLNSLLKPDEALNLCKTQDWCYGNLSYFINMGALFAERATANDMLFGAYKSFFEPYKEFYSQSEFELLKEFFWGRPDSPDNEVALKVKRATIQQCRTSMDFDRFVIGMRIMLKAKSDFWSGIHRLLLKPYRNVKVTA